MINNMRRKMFLTGFLAFAACCSNAQEKPRTVEVHAKRYSFSPDEITISKGEKVTLVISSEDATHSLVIPGLHVNQEISKGHPVSVEINSDEVGDFVGQCGHFCGNGHGSMRFVVHVKGD